MANAMTEIMPKILARGLLALREQAIMPRLVNADYSNDAARKGDTVDVPLPSAITASDVTPSNAAPQPDDITISKVQVPLDKWKKAGFYLTDFAYLRHQRNLSEKIGVGVRLMVLTSIISAGLATIWIGIRHSLR